MVFVFHKWVSLNEKLRKGDTAEIVAGLNFLLLLFVFTMDVSTTVHKLGLVIAAIFVTLG